MVRGQVATIPSGQSVLLTTLSREEKQSISILNPNDGVVYLRLNASASVAPTNWDWKVPSQSYGQYPGPWQSIGLFYQDLSGSNAAGQVNIYESDAELAIPSIVAIGRAVQVAGTQLDITTGTIPQNPPASTIRMWVDASGHLHLLDSSGSDKTVVDSNNVSSYVQPLINATALGGDLYGTIPNGHISVQSGSNIIMANLTKIYWSDTNHQIYCDASNNMFFDNWGTWYWRSSSQSFATRLSLDANGNLSPAASIFLGNNQWLFLGSGNTNGIISDNSNLYIRTNGNVQIQNTSGSLTNLSAAVLTASSQLQTGNQLNFTNDGALLFTSGGYIYMRSANTNGIVIQSVGGVSAGVNCSAVTANPGGISSQGAVDTAVWMRSQSGQVYLGTTGVRIDIGSGQMDYLGPNGSTNHRFFHQDGSWMGTQAANFQQQSDLDTKDDIVEMSDEDCLARIRQAISVITWQPDWQEQRAIGFGAQTMAPIVPEVVSLDETGKPMAIQYGSLAALLWGAVRLIDQRLTKLEPLDVIVS